MLQPSPVPANSFAERFRAGAGHRTLGIGLALLIELLLLLLLLTLGPEEQAGEKDKGLTVVNLQADEPSEQAPEARGPKREQKAMEPPSPELPTTQEALPPQPVEPKPMPVAPPVMPTEQQPPIPSRPTRPASSNRPAYGPPDRGGSSYSRDTERVGTAPNGEPLYAAAWYREPRDDELSGYLSTASGPGWGLIACRTAPDYRVEDCVGLGEYPEGSQIMRAVLAAAWQFKVRSPQRGGRSLVGSWVRIRIDYDIRRR